MRKALTLSLSPFDRELSFGWREHLFAKRQLEAVATLPRNQQQKILALVEAMIAHHAGR